MLVAVWILTPPGPTKLSVVEREPTLTMRTSSADEPPPSRNAWLSSSGAAWMDIGRSPVEVTRLAMRVATSVRRAKSRTSASTPSEAISWLSQMTSLSG